MYNIIKEYFTAEGKLPGSFSRIFFHVHATMLMDLRQYSMNLMKLFFFPFILHGKNQLKELRRN